MLRLCSMWRLRAMIPIVLMLVGLLDQLSFALVELNSKLVLRHLRLWDPMVHKDLGRIQSRKAT